MPSLPYVQGDSPFLDLKYCIPYWSKLSFIFIFLKKITYLKNNNYLPKQNLLLPSKSCHLVQWCNKICWISTKLSTIKMAAPIWRSPVFFKLTGWHLCNVLCLCHNVKIIFLCIICKCKKNQNDFYGHLCISIKQQKIKIYCSKTDNFKQQIKEFENVTE